MGDSLLNQKNSASQSQVRKLRFEGNIGGGNQQQYGVMGIRDENGVFTQQKERSFTTMNAGNMGTNRENNAVLAPGGKSPTL